MNNEQKTQYVAFMSNLMKLLSEEKMSPEQALRSAIAASSCLLAVVFEIVPNDADNVEDFAVPVIHAALNSFYGVQADRAMLH